MPKIDTSGWTVRSTNVDPGGMQYQVVGAFPSGPYFSREAAQAHIDTITSGIASLADESLRESLTKSITRFPLSIHEHNVTPSRFASVVDEHGNILNQTPRFE